MPIIYKGIKEERLPRNLSISTGVKSIDELPFRLRVGVLHLIYGMSGAGKTTIAGYVPIIKIAQYFLKKTGDIPQDIRFVVLDTDNGFDESRLRKMLEANKLPAKEIINNMILHYVFFSFSEQHSFIISQGRSELEQLVEDEKVVFITLDPATYFYRQEIMAAPRQTRAIVTQEKLGKIDKQLNKLRKLAMEYGLIITATTWPMSEAGPALMKYSGEIKMPVRDFIGGDQTLFLAKSIYRVDYIYVPSADKPGMFEEHPSWRKLVNKKERDVEKGKSCYFKLTHAGLGELMEDELKIVQKYEEIIAKFRAEQEKKKVMKQAASGASPKKVRRKQS